MDYYSLINVDYILWRFIDQIDRAFSLNKST